MIGDPLFQNNFESRFSTFLSKIEDINKIIFFCEEQIRKVEFRNIDDKVIYTFFRQIVESFHSIFILTGNGFARNSMQLLRSMFEHCVTMRYLKELLDNPIQPTEDKPYPDNTKKFLDFYYINHRKQFNRLKEFFPEEFSDDYIKEIEDNYKSVEKTFKVDDCKKCGSQRTNHQWSKMDTIAMANKVGLGILTQECYLRTLIFSHPSANSIEERWIMNSDGSINYEFKSEKDEEMTLRNSHLILLISIETLFNYFQIDDKDDLLKHNWDIWNEVWS